MTRTLSVKLTVCKAFGFNMQSIQKETQTCTIFSLNIQIGLRLLCDSVNSDQTVPEENNKFFITTFSTTF